MSLRVTLIKINSETVPKPADNQHTKLGGHRDRYNKIEKIRKHKHANLHHLCPNREEESSGRFQAALDLHRPTTCLTQHTASLLGVLGEGFKSILLTSKICSVVYYEN